MICGDAVCISLCSLPQGRRCLRPCLHVEWSLSWGLHLHWVPPKSCKLLFSERKYTAWMVLVFTVHLYDFCLQEVAPPLMARSQQHTWTHVRVGFGWIFWSTDLQKLLSTWYYGESSTHFEDVPAMEHEETELRILAMHNTKLTQHTCMPDIIFRISGIGAGSLQLHWE